MMNIRKSFSTKLALGILLLAIPIFILSLGVLFTQSRHIIRKEADTCPWCSENSTHRRTAQAADDGTGCFRDYDYPRG